MKHRIQRDFFGDRHHVWCSEALDSSKLNRYARGARMPASSDPYQIYRELSRIIGSNDNHGSKIVEQRKTLTALAVDLALKGNISEDDRDLIVAMVRSARLTDFAPLLFVIPCNVVRSRAVLVPPEQWAGSKQEWIVPDLSQNEFDIVELGI